MNVLAVTVVVIIVQRVEYRVAKVVKQEHSSKIRNALAQLNPVILISYSIKIQYPINVRFVNILANSARHKQTVYPAIMAISYRVLPAKISAILMNTQTILT